MSGRHQSPEMSLVVSGERCHLALFVFHSESGIRERFRAGTIISDRPGLSRTNCNYSFDACLCSGRSLPRRETSAHNRQNEHESWKPQHSNLSPRDPSRSTIKKHKWPNKAVIRVIRGNSSPPSCTFVVRV
jgi:hypothetical protein